MVTSQEITNIINISYEGVEASKFGKLLTGEKDPNGYAVYNSVSLNVFMNILVHTLGAALKKDK